MTVQAVEMQKARSKTRKKTLLTPSVKMFLWRIAAIAIVLAVWQLIVVVGITTEFWVSKPSLVFDQLRELFSTSTIWGDIWVTLKATLLGFLIGCSSGAALGVFLGMWRWLGDVLDPLIMALNSLPRIALAPLFVLYFGIGSASKIALAVSLVFFIMLINARTGVRSADPDLVNAVRTMGASRWFVLRRVLLPGTVPWLLSGARISIAFSLIGVVVGEMIVSQRGLGHMIAQASSQFDTTGVFAVVIILAFGAILLDQLLLWVERTWGRRFGSNI